MKYELINPSDKIYFDTDGSREAETALCYIVLVVSGGQMALRREDGEDVLPSFIFAKEADLLAYWKTRTDAPFGDWPMQNLRLIATVSASARYASERTSMRKIVDAFHDNAKRLSAQADRIEREAANA